MRDPDERSSDPLMRTVQDQFDWIDKATDVLRALRAYVSGDLLVEIDELIKPIAGNPFGLSLRVATKSETGGGRRAGKRPIRRQA